MLENIRSLMQVKEHIEEIKRASVQNRDSIIALAEDVEGVKKKLSELKAKHDEFAKSLSSNVSLITQSKDELRQAVYDFKLITADVQKRILEKFEEEVRGSISKELEKLKSDVSSYNELKDRIAMIAIKTQALASEMDKFLQVSQGIKQKDFELEKFAKQLLEMDKEKLELMRKIDTLERLVARMRQGG